MNSSEKHDASGATIRARPDEKPPRSRLLLICHGEGMQHRYAGLGSLNSGLTARGWSEVEVLAQWLSTHEPLKALYSDPLLQSRLTAQRIGQAVRLPVAALREPVHLAAPQALDTQDAQNGSATWQPPNEGGETAATDLPSIQELLDGNATLTIALVTSPDSIRDMLRTLLEANDTPILLDHTSITCLQRREQRWAIAYVNRREHLPLPASAPADDTHHRADSAEPIEDMASVVTVYDRVAREDAGEKVSDDRERISSMLNFAALPKGLRILDAGAGLGVLSLMLAERGAASVVGVDISTAMLEQAEYLRLSQPSDTTNRVSYRLANLQMLPFPNEFFDVVTCRLVLNHFHSPQRIVEEFVRVLRPGGIFLMAELLSVADPVKRATQNAIEERRNPAHVAARSAEQYDKMITDAGLEIEKTESVDIPRNLREWLNAYHTPDAVAATVIEMVEAGLETDAAGIGARRRGASIEFVQRMYYLKATKPQE
ncbi:MAG: methyltransferase domain-containing protein [Caldilineaceae bacterium]